MSQPAVVTDLDLAAHEALQMYDFSPGAQLTLINVSENTTYRVDDPAGGRVAAMRVHRPNYHTHGAIESELDWMDALRADGVVEPPRPVLTRDGARVATVQAGDQPRSVVVFEWLAGASPTPDGDLVPSFNVLGSLAARMHVHGAQWQLPPSFERYTCDYEAALGARAMWGRWQSGLGIGTSESHVLGRLDAEIKRRLTEYGTAPDQFGLSHNDLRLANLLIDGEHTHVIDFDDCGFSWYMYDFATAVSFLEDDSRAPDWMASWVDGYSRHRRLSEADLAILPTLVMFRRLLLVGWVGSHFEYASEAAELGAQFTTVTCDLAEAYLSGHYLS